MGIRDYFSKIRLKNKWELLRECAGVRRELRRELRQYANLKDLSDDQYNLLDKEEQDKESRRRTAKRLATWYIPVEKFGGRKLTYQDYYRWAEETGNLLDYLRKQNEEYGILENQKSEETNGNSCRV